MHIGRFDPGGVQIEGFIKPLRPGNFFPDGVRNINSEEQPQIAHSLTRPRKQSQTQSIEISNPNCIKEIQIFPSSRASDRKQDVII